MKMNIKILRRKKVLCSVPWVCLCLVVFYMYATEPLYIMYTNTKDIVRMSATVTATPISKNNVDAISDESSSNRCYKLTFPGHLTTDRWQNVGTDGQAFVYSAFLENNIIKVIGIELETGSFICQLWYQKSDGSSLFAISVKAFVRPIHLHKENR